MSMLNISELHKERNDRIERKKKIYDKVLQKCHHRIKLAAKQNPYDCMCYFIIPKVIYGIPLYNLEECINYLYKNLNENGFKLYYTHPNFLIISWIDTQNKTKESTKLPFSNLLLNKNNVNSVSNYKPSSSLIYNKNSLENLNKKKHLLLN